MDQPTRWEVEEITRGTIYRKMEEPGQLENHNKTSDSPLLIAAPWGEHPLQRNVWTGMENQDRWMPCMTVTGEIGGPQDSD